MISQRNVTAKGGRLLRSARLLLVGTLIRGTSCSYRTTTTLSGTLWSPRGLVGVHSPKRRKEVLPQAARPGGRPGSSSARSSRSSSRGSSEEMSSGSAREGACQETSTRGDEKGTLEGRGTPAGAPQGEGSGHLRRRKEGGASRGPGGNGCPSPGDCQDRHAT